jgi:hypothetical protein
MFSLRDQKIRRPLFSKKQNGVGETRLILWLIRCVAFNGRLMDLKGFRRKRSWLDVGTIWKFAWRDQGKPGNTSVRLPGAPTEIRIESIRHHAVSYKGSQVIVRQPQFVSITAGDSVK